MSYEVPARKFSYTRFKNKQSYKDIKLTSHAICRGEERLGIYKKDELRKMASQAKFQGLNLSLIREENYKNFNLTWEEYLLIKNNFNLAESKIYLYKGKIFVFAGKKKNTLKTVVNLREEK